MKDQAQRDDLNAGYVAPGEFEQRVYPAPCARPCNECPWRRDSVPGHVGPHDPEHWTESAHSDAAIACHKTLPPGGGWGTATKQCRGAAIFRENVCKSPRNPSIVTGPADRDKVFVSNAEFIAHHRS